MAVERTNLWPLRFGASHRNRSLGLASRSSSAPRLRQHSPSRSRPSATCRSQSARSLVPARASFLRQLHQRSQPLSLLAATFRNFGARLSAPRGESFLPYRPSSRRSFEPSRSLAGPLLALPGVSYPLRSLRPFHAPSRRSTSSSARGAPSARSAAYLAPRPRRWSSLLTALLRSDRRAVKSQVAWLQPCLARRAARSAVLHSQPRSAPRSTLRMVA